MIRLEGVNDREGAEALVGHELLVRADEAHHRDINHGLASHLAGEPVRAEPPAPYPEHADPGKWDPKQ